MRAVARRLVSSSTAEASWLARLRVGLELHVQLQTRTKLFSAAAQPSMDECGANQSVAAHDAAEPGTLPMLNRRAVELALRAAHLLGCRISERTRFDRKHYFYADMPAGYQITQAFHPIAKDGRYGFHVFDANGPTTSQSVGIIQVQLEQDSGRTLHRDNRSFVDLNRAGIALIELVTAPDFRSSSAVACFVQQLRADLQHNRICGGQMHKGELRVDANVSLDEPDGSPGQRVELKNINGIRATELAIEFEAKRQAKLRAQGMAVEKETRGVDQQTGQTLRMRDKEVETDYRLMPEPNLPWLTISTTWSEEEARNVRLDAPWRVWMERGVEAKSAVGLQDDKPLTDFLDVAYENAREELASKAQDLLNWLPLLRQCLENGPDGKRAKFPPAACDRVSREFGRIVALERAGKVTRAAAFYLIRHYVANPDEANDVTKLIEVFNLRRVTDPIEVEKLCRQTIDKISSRRDQAKMTEKQLRRLRNRILEADGLRLAPQDVDEALTRVE